MAIFKNPRKHFQLKFPTYMSKSLHFLTHFLNPFFTISLLKFRFKRSKFRRFFIPSNYYALLLVNKVNSVSGCKFFWNIRKYYFANMIRRQYRWLHLLGLINLYIGKRLYIWRISTSWSPSNTNKHDQHFHQRWIERLAWRKFSRERYGGTAFLIILPVYYCNSISLFNQRFIISLSCVYLHLISNFSN